MAVAKRGGRWQARVPRQSLLQIWQQTEEEDVVEEDWNEQQLLRFPSRIAQIDQL
jgi:hypothetical protein